MMELSQVMTTDGKTDCAVCDKKWQTRDDKKYQTGSKSVPFISTVSLLTKSGKYVSINFCDVHQTNLPAFTQRNENSISVRNIMTLSTNEFKRARK